MKLIILVVGITLLVGIIVIFGLPGKHGAIEISPLEYELGDISMAEGLVYRTFEIKNVGEGELSITDIRTSCMCTTAILTVDGETSPQFGMHSNTMLWSEKISPGQVGILEVTFDPAFHGPNGTGKFVRTINVSNNDRQVRVIKLRLTGNIIP